MGLLDNITQETYYGGSDLGNYQFTSMDNIISAFMVAYVGEDKIISKISRTDVQFHAMRAIQELSYDVFRSVKSQEIEVPATLRMPLPQDYVNYVKVVRVDNNGIERVLYPTSKTSNPFAIVQNVDGTYAFYAENSGHVEEQGGPVIGASGDGAPYESDTWTSYQNQTVSDAYADDSTDIEIDSRGRRYGLDPQHAQANGTFFIDTRTGNIFFGSSLAGQTITLKYVSDGLGTDAEMVVHKFCEEACYKWIAYGILSVRSNIPPFIIQRFKKEKFAETRKAKIRLSNIKIEEFTQILKGLSKPIK
jgi:virulence-associated protein VagC